MKNEPTRTVKGACWRLAVGGAGLVLAGVLGACAPMAGGPEQDEFVEVTIRNTAFVPRDITIQKGQTVRWTNEDPVFHTVTSGSPGDADAGALFDSHDLIPFASFRHQFNEVGEFVYFSELDQGRPAMVGARVIVTE